MPHGHCFLWQPGILWVTVVSDLIIGISYFLISAALIVFVKKRHDLSFRGIFFLFGSFILWCGLTHLFAIHTIWHGAYGIMAIIKLITAAVSAITAVILILNFKNILQIPNLQEYKKALKEATNKEIERRQLEAQNKAESIFKFAIELLPTGLLVLNSDKRIVVANKALERMFGYQRNELIEQSISILLKDSQARHHEMLVQQYLNNPSQDHAMAAGRVVRGRKKSGEDVAIEISLSVYELEGSPHAFASVVDVDHATEEQRQFIENSNRLKRAIDAANDGIWEWNVQTNDVWYSAPLMRMIGHDPEIEEPQLQHWLNHIHPDEEERMNALLRDHFSNKARYDVIYRGKSENGEYQWMHVRGDTRFDKDDKPLLMSGTLTNIHDKKLLEEKLAEKTWFLNAVLEKSLCGIYIFDLKTKKNVYVNEQYTAITGYTLTTLEEHQRNTLLPLFHPDDEQRIQEHFAHVPESTADQGESIDYRFRHKDGRWIWCYSRDSVYSRDKQGNAMEIIGTFFDITDIKVAEKSLAQSNAALERFAYSASHDLQEPLRKISAFSSSLENRLTGKLDDPDARYELDRIANAASRMREMIDSLLQLSRYSRQKVSKEIVPLAELLQVVCDDLSELISENNARVILVNSVAVYADISSFQQILRNLITNSIRYARPGLPPVIEVSACLAGNRCEINLKDNGCGFPQESAETIFEPFKRLAGRNIPGSGMGLAICHQIMQAHSGSISAKSTPDEGATFTLSIPINVRE